MQSGLPTGPLQMMGLHAFLIVTMQNLRLVIILAGWVHASDLGLGPSGGSPGIHDEGAEDWSSALAAVRSSAAAYRAAPAWSLDLKSRYTEETPVGRLRLSRWIATTEDSTVWEGTLAGAAEPVVAKYTNDCSRRHRGDTGGVPVDEFIFLSAISDAGIAPQVYAISAPAAVTRGSLSSVKVKSGRIGSSAPETCLAIGTTVRLLIEGKAGMSVREYVKLLRALVPPDSKAFLRSVLTLGWKSVDLIRRLHSRGIIHGDIQDGNILFKTSKSSYTEYDVATDDLVLVDFGFSQFFPFEIGTDDIKPIRQGLNPRLLSLWHLYQFRIGRRDDVYRVLLMLSDMLSDGTVDVGVELLVDRKLSSLSFRDRRDRKIVSEEIHGVVRQCRENFALFKRSAGLGAECCRKMGLSDSDRGSVQTNLEAIVNEIKKIPSPDSIPPYEWVIDQLKLIAASLDAPRADLGLPVFTR